MEDERSDATVESLPGRAWANIFFFAAGPIDSVIWQSLERLVCLGPQEKGTARKEKARSKAWSAGSAWRVVCRATSCHCYRQRSGVAQFETKRLQSSKTHEDAHKDTRTHAPTHTNKDTKILNHTDTKILTHSTFRNMTWQSLGQQPVSHIQRYTHRATHTLRDTHRHTHRHTETNRQRHTQQFQDSSRSPTPPHTHTHTHITHTHQNH